MAAGKRTILVFVGVYLPGYRGGGPIRSVSNLVELLGDEFNFKIVTADHDFGVAKPYSGITSDTWCRVGKADVYYASKKSLRLYSMAKLINSVDHDLIYLNDFFCWDFTIKPLLLRYLKLIRDVVTIVAPRGEFSTGSLKQKWFKKRVYIFIVRIIGLYNKIVWQASSKYEEIYIRNVLGDVEINIGPPIIVASDLVCYEMDDLQYPSKVKKQGALEIVFLSRISPEKNLDGALSMLKGMQGEIVFNIFGPAKNQKYFQTCQNICEGFGSNIKAVFHGEVDHARVHEIFSSHHLFFLPTQGENFGHVILEALLAGCPVLLSDQTPWRDLESLGIGWDIPLNRPDKFKAALECCVQMDNDEFAKFSRRVVDFGRSQLNDTRGLEQNRELFHSA